MMHLHHSRFLTRGEVWYDDEPDQASVDWIMYHQRSNPAPGTKWKDFYSYVLDLTQPSERLVANFGKNNAYKIRRARDKDGIVCECPNPADAKALDAFESAFNQFAAEKGLPRLDRPYMDQLAKDGALELSVAKDREGNAVAHHTYYKSPARSCLLHAASSYKSNPDSAARNAIGRANRYLFWRDILRHQEQGLKVFDFGGWYPGNTDKARLEINRFKEEFAGKVIREYDCEEVVSFKGWIVLQVASLVNSARNLTQIRRGRLLEDGPRSSSFGTQSQSAPATQTAQTQEVQP